MAQIVADFYTSVMEWGCRNQYTSVIIFLAGMVALAIGVGQYRKSLSNPKRDIKEHNNLKK